MSKKVIEIDGNSLARRALTPAQATMLYEHRAGVLEAGQALSIAAARKKEAQQDYDQAVADLMAYVDELQSGQTRLGLDEAGPRGPAEGEEADA